ncbi:MAG: choice-of-anchor J domain-containing protein [Paludibacteraceae bacterium]|nr:choice-of-anchor J domain-containing protein [Paludibacteraceae bacterium]
MTQHLTYYFSLLAIALAVCACEHSDFPAGPESGGRYYDTILIPGLDVTPISVRTAYNIGRKLANEKQTPETYYIAGIVSKFDGKHAEGMSSSYHNAIFYIRDNTHTLLDFEGYQVMNIDGAPFNISEYGLDQIKKGDTVVICSPIYRYGGKIETPGKSVAKLYWSSNDLCYPKRTFSYFTDEIKQKGLEGWTEKIITDPETTVWSAASGKLTAQAVKDGAKKESEVWLVSPAVDLTAQQAKAPQLSFKTYYLQGDNALAHSQMRLKVSKDDGQTWGDIEIPKLGTSLRNTLTDTIDISAYVSAQTRFAFAYKSTEEVAAKWNVSDISIWETRHVRPQMK